MPALSLGTRALAPLVLSLGVASAFQQAPVFRTGVDYVSVDVVVTDAAGRPAAGLTSDDFELTDQGRRQRIADFRYMSIPVSARSLTEEGLRFAEPDVATNVPATPASRLFVIVVDDLHLTESEIVPVRRVLVNVLEALTPEDQVAVVFAGRSDLSENFTSSPGRLLDATERVRDAFGFGLDALNRSTNVRTSVPFYNRAALGQHRSAILTLRNVVGALAGSAFPRRAVVYVSGGVATDLNASVGNPEYRDSLVLADELQRLFEVGRRSGVPIYAIDPRGAVLPEDVVRGGADAITSPEVRREVTRRMRIQHDYLSAVALNTGGRAFVNQSDLPAAVRQLVGENGSFYVIGYTPDPFVRDGKFHEIDVRVRRPGLHVRARQGYLAPSPAQGTEQARSALSGAIEAAINVSDLHLRGIATAAAAGPDLVTALVSVEVSYPVPRGEQRRIDDTLHLTIVALDSEGKVRTTTNNAWTVRATAPNADVVTFLVSDAIELPPDPVMLRVGVASQSLGKAGSVHIPYHSPDLSSREPQIGAPALGFAGPPRQPVLGGDVIRKLLPFQPTTSRIFAAADTLRLFVPVFWNSREDAVHVTVAVNGPVSQPPRTERIAARAVSGNRRQASLDTTLTLLDLPPGAYILAVEARLASSRAARREIPFEIK